MVSTIYIYFLSCSEMNGSVQFALKMRWRPSNILSGSLIDIGMCVDIDTYVDVDMYADIDMHVDIVCV